MENLLLTGLLDKLLVFRSVAMDSGGSGLKESIVRLAMRNGNA